METVKLEVERGVATLTIARPKALNAVDQTVVDEVTQVVRELEQDHALRALIVTGEGDKAFVAGADIKAMSTMSGIEAERFSTQAHAMILALESLAVPVISAVNGFCLGGGLELALCADIIYASDNAKFGQPEVNLGLMPGMGGTVRLQRRIGAQAASELIFSGETIDAARALSLGLVQAVWPLCEMRTQARAMADKIASRAPLAVRASKRLIRAAAEMPLREACMLEAKAFALLFTTEDKREGTQAFIDKRAAAFTGR